MKVLEILSKEDTGKGYVIHKEIWQAGDCEPHEMTQAYTPSGDYIGNIKTAELLCVDRGIAPEKASSQHNVCSIGFCEKEQKWYGWSHRAMYGFSIGSKCEKGDVHYTGTTPQELIDDYANFFADISQECADRHRAQCQPLEDGSGIRILHEPVIVDAVSMEDVVGALEGEDVQKTSVDIMPGYSIQKCGRGEWTAKTLDDAKQMAIDFAEGVS